MSTINLKELVQEIRKQLEELDQERIAQGTDAMFELQNVELELKFTVRGSSSQKGGLDIKIVTAGTEKQEGTETIQTIKISYKASPLYQGVGTRAHHSTTTADKTGVKGIKPMR
jgi:hypothetical protein